MKKIVQIAMAGHANTIGTQSDWTLIALRADGKLLSMDSTGRWRKIELPNDCQTDKESRGRGGKRSVPASDDDTEFMPDAWVAIAKRVIAGEQVKRITKEINRNPATVRNKVLRVFERSNPSRYAELHAQHDFGCTEHPSMRLLVQYHADFGL